MLYWNSPFNLLFVDVDHDNVSIENYQEFHIIERETSQKFRILKTISVFILYFIHDSPQFAIQTIILTNDRTLGVKDTRLSNSVFIWFVL